MLKGLRANTKKPAADNHRQRAFELLAVRFGQSLRHIPVHVFFQCCQRDSPQTQYGVVERARIKRLAQCGEERVFHQSFALEMHRGGPP